MRDGHVVEAAYKEPFDLLIAVRSSSTTMWWAGKDSNLPDVRKRVRACIEPLPFGDTARLYARPGEGS